MAGEVHQFFNKTENYLHKDFGVRIRAEIIRDLVGTPHGKEIFDVGCGNGGVSMQFLPDNKVTFLDLSENMLELVRRNTPDEWMDKTKRVNVPIEEFRPEGIFDYVLAIGLFSHVTSIDQTLKHLISAMKPGGRMIIQFSDYDSWLIRWRIRLAKKYKYRVNRIRYEEFLKKIEAAGLIIEKEVQYSILLPGMGILPNGILYKFMSATYTNRFLGSMGTDFIWSLKRRT